MVKRSDAGATRWMQDTLKQGFSLLSAGRLDAASDCCKRLLEAEPQLVEAHFLVGLIAVELKQTWTAVSAFGSVTRLNKKHGAAWAQLARLYMLAGQPARADAALAKAVAHNDGNPVILNLIGATYSLLGDQPEACTWIEGAVSKEPQSVPFLVDLASNYMFLGRLDEAATVLRQVLELQPENPNANWMFSNIKKADNREHVESLERMVKQPGRSPRALAFLNYGLGKELEDLEEWDNAFAAFARGAEARRRTIDFNERAEVEMFAAFGEVFTASWLQDGGRGHEDASPVFVVGQPRTGTTLVERIITSHTAVHSAGELRQFGNALRRLVDYRERTRYSARLAQLAADVDAEKLGNSYLLTTAKLRGDTPRFVDKLPPNYLFIPLILKALPNARIVHLTRDPMDACFASFKQLFADAYPHSYDQAEMARHHARYFHLMALWRERFPDRFYDISYEATAQNLEPNARALIDYLGLPWEDACLEFHKHGAAVTTASAVQVRQPAHTRSIGRWRRYESHLATMRATLVECGVPVD